MKARKIVLLVLFISLGLRLILAYINREANDNHIEIVSWIADKHTLPQRNDCMECSQPKFFYIISAGIIIIFDIHTPEHRIMAIQFFNAILGFFTILLFWKFIKKQHFDDVTQVLIFSFFAFNPCLTGINIQATNHTLEIFSGVAAIYFCDSLFSNTTTVRTQNLSALLLLISLLVAALTKAIGILFFMVITVFFIIKIITETNPTQKSRLSRYLACAILCFSCVVIFAGGYYTFYKKYNSLPTIPWSKPEPPSLFKDTYVNRPGITSIVNGFFTFRYFDMIRQPYINNEVNNYPPHRTSLWSQLYGRTVFAQFDQWPPAWQTHAPVVIFFGRVLIFFGIVPLLLFLWGFYIGVSEFFNNTLKRGKAYLAEDNNYLHLGITIALFATIIKYSYDYRDFSFMKSIYIFPGFLSFIKIFMDGYGLIKSKSLIKLVNAILVIMIFFSIADIGYLIYQLHYRF